MECPFCYTNFEFDLSICPSCGKDMSDPIYHELFSSVKPRFAGKPPAASVVSGEISNIAPELKELIARDRLAETAPKKEIREKPVVTTEIRTKDTCNTLLDFPAKKPETPEIPEWRQELRSRLQNIKEQRGSQPDSMPPAPAPGVRTEAVAAARHAIGNTGLAIAVLETPPAVPESAHPLMRKALERIERSRTKYESSPVTAAATAAAPAYQPAYQVPLVTAKPRLFVPGPEPEGAMRPFIHCENVTVEDRLPLVEQNFAGKLAQAAELRNSLCGEKFSTNKLRQLDLAAEAAGDLPVETISLSEIDEDTADHIIKAESIAEKAATENAGIVSFDEEETEEIAPFVFRFNAGLFDLIISSFLSLIVLSPYLLMGGNWFSLEGALAFLVTCSVVMFLYVTASVGMIGRTLGMTLFSLEMIDIEGKDYPSFSQAALSSGVYLGSLALGGLGFATMFMNEEKRAVHDLVSGTIVVREG